nr:hypothetical protein [Phytoactinopolyspora mesophila]
MTRRNLLGAALAGLSVPAIGACSSGAETGGSPPTPAAPTEPDTTNFAVTNAVVFDGERVLDADTVVVRDGLLDEIITGPPSAGVEVLDAKGRVLLPGLIDAHVHIATRLSRPALRFGTTTMFEMFGPVASSFRADRTSMTQPKGADVWTAGILVTAPEGHGTQFGEIPTVDADTDIPGFVANRLDKGSDYIKLVIEDGGLYGGSLNTLTPEQVEAVVAAAHDHGVLAVAHVATCAHAAIAVAAGVDALVHAPGDGHVRSRGARAGRYRSDQPGDHFRCEYPARDAASGRRGPSRRGRAGRGHVRPGRPARAH